MLANLLTECRLTLRVLARSPLYVSCSVVILGLCLAANVVIFDVVYEVLLKPLPFAASSQLVCVYDSYAKAGIARAGTSPLHVLEWKSGVKAFSEVAAWQAGSVTLGHVGNPGRVSWAEITPSFFKVLRVLPALGCDFVPADAKEGAGNVAIISDALWRSQFGSDPNVIGRDIWLNGIANSIVGVAPANFRFVSQQVQVWTPLVFRGADLQATQRYRTGLEMFARLREGDSVRSAQTQVNALNSREVPGDDLRSAVQAMGYHTVVADLHEDSIAGLKPALSILQVSAVFVLAVAGVNLSTLMLVRTVARSKMWSIRRALGAGPARLAAILFLEAGLLAAVAFGAGTLVAADTVQWLSRFPGPLAGFALPGAISLAALAAGFVLTLIVAVFVAVPSVWQLSRMNLPQNLTARSATLSHSGARLQQILIVTQVALAAVLLYGASLLGLSFFRSASVAPGFVPQDVTSVDLDLPWSVFRTPAAMRAATDRVLAQVRGLPGVAFAACVTRLPFGGDVRSDNDFSPLIVENRPLSPVEAKQEQYFRGATDDYFQALRIPLKEGRYLTAADYERCGKVCVIDEIVARRYWPHGGALGHRLSFGLTPQDRQYLEIVGVVGAAKQSDLVRDRAFGVVYFPQSLFPFSTFSLVLRTKLPPEGISAELRRVVGAVDPEISVGLPRKLIDQIDRSMDDRRPALAGSAAFAMLALIFSAIGIYGVLALNVAIRRKEIGIRMALGATGGRIRTQYFRFGLRLTGIGIGAGAIGAWLAGDLLESELYGVSAHSVTAYAASMGVLLVIALIASAAPAVQAGGVNLTGVLNGE